MYRLCWVIGFAFIWPIGSFGSGHATSEGLAAFRKLGTGCGFAHVQVQSTAVRDQALVCEALADVLRYFERLGFTVEPAFVLRFQEPEVELPSRGGGLQSYGYFDRTTSNIIIHRLAKEKPWGLQPRQEMLGSFVRHELVHMALRDILKEDNDKIRREWHEFIAYSIQFDLMSPALRSEILARHPSVGPYESLLHVNEFTFSNADPDVFSIAAYKTYLANGGPQFVAQLIRFEVIPPAPENIFPPNFFDQPKAN